VPLKIKICCIGSAEEARLASECGADALGLVSEMPSGPGVISEEIAREIVGGLPAGIRTFLLTSKLTAEDIVSQCRFIKPTTLQLVDKMAPSVYEELRRHLPETELIQVIHVSDESSLIEARAVEPFIDGILLDSGNAQLLVKELGGTGRTHDWSISRSIVDSVRVPVYLAGGLNPANIREAVEKVRPDGVDVCSGVRTSGKLDRDKVSSFIAAAREATRA
jgi:phosphoribosylanthranilate isomerase